MTLLEKALEFKEIIPERKTIDVGLAEECQLALAYHSREVYAPAVAAALGLEKSSGVSAWFASVVMKGIRAGLLTVSITENPK